MPSLLYELENNEALLLMYISGELPAEDRAEVEQMLASDGGLRMELEEIRAALAESMGMVSAIDQLEPISASAELVAVRNVSKAMRQWKVDRLLAQPAQPPGRAWRYPMWVYPTSAVASILVGVLVWWGLSSPTVPDGGVGGGFVASTANGTAPVNNSASNTGMYSSGTGVRDSAPPTDNDDAATRLANSLFSSEPAGLADAEAQANSLTSRSDDTASSLFPNVPAQ